MVGQHRPIPEGHVAHKGRGLCGTCYDGAYQRGELDQFPLLIRPAAAVAEDHDFLATQGLDPAEIAEQIGLKPKSLERALQRHRARGWSPVVDDRTHDEYPAVIA